MAIYTGAPTPHYTTEEHFQFVVRAAEKHKAEVPPNDDRESDE